MVKKILLVLLVMLTASAAIGKDITCKQAHVSSPIFHKADNAKTFVVPKNKSFRIELPSNPTTGFNWYIDKLDKTFFKIKKSGFNPSASHLIGAGGTAFWELVPMKQGYCRLRLLYYRSWEGKSKAVDEYTLRIRSR